MPRQFVSKPCRRCDVKGSVEGHKGFCSDECRRSPNRSTKKRKTTRAQSFADPSEQPRSGRPATKNQPLGSACFTLWWFSITIGIGNNDIGDEYFPRMAAWFDAVAVRGSAATERGNRKNLLHIQAAAEIRAPPAEDKGHLAVSKSLRLFLQIPTGMGWKLTVKYFAKTQSPSAMVGYTLKDRMELWFNFMCKGLSHKDLCKGIHDYMAIKQSYANGKQLLEKKGFIYAVYKFYGQYLHPLRMTVCQVVRFMLLSGTWTFGNSWIFSPNDRPLDYVKLNCLWDIISDIESVTIGAISTILYNDESAAESGQRHTISAITATAVDDNFASNADYLPFSTNAVDPNDTRSWEDAKDLARAARCTPEELEDAAGHIFGENYAVPTHTVVTHTGGLAIAGALERASTAIPEGTDPADATDTALPFVAPRDTGATGSDREDEWSEDDQAQGAAQWSSADSGSEEEVQPKRKKKNSNKKKAAAALNLDDSDSDSGSIGF